MIKSRRRRRMRKKTIDFCKTAWEKKVASTSKHVLGIIRFSASVALLFFEMMTFNFLPMSLFTRFWLSRRKKELYQQQHTHVAGTWINKKTRTHAHTPRFVDLICLFTLWFVFLLLLELKSVSPVP